MEQEFKQLELISDSGEYPKEMKIENTIYCFSVNGRDKYSFVKIENDTIYELNFVTGAIVLSLHKTYEDDVKRWMKNQCTKEEYERGIKGLNAVVGKFQ